jgi:hypothetical protein
MGTRPLSNLEQPIAACSAAAGWFVVPAQDEQRVPVHRLRLLVQQVLPRAPIDPARLITREMIMRRFRTYVVAGIVLSCLPWCLRRKFWTQPSWIGSGKGRRTTTRMAQEIAETYARDPKFYGGTFY